MHDAPGGRCARARSAPTSRSASRDDGDGTTVAYDADAVVGGMIGGVGQRMLAAASRKRMAGEFFGNVDGVLDRSAPRRRRSSAAAASRGGRRRSSPRPARRRVGSQHDFLKGIAVGAGLVLARRARGPLLRGGDADDDITVDSTCPRPWPPPCRPREISARELLDLHLARIAERNPELNAIVSLDEERARAGAAAADEGWPLGEPVGPLHGLPFAFKDTHDVGRLAHDVRLAALRRPRARADELVVERIRRGGRGTARQDQRAGVRGRARTPSTRSSAPRSTPSTRPGRPAAPAGARRARWPRAWCRSPTAPTWAARCATRRRSAASSGCGPRSAGCPSGRPPTCGRPRRSPARWPATSATWRCCCR